MIRLIPALLLALGLGITAAQTPAKLAHSVNTHQTGVVQW